MDPLLVTAAALLFVIGILHSFLGERFILVRLFRLDLPQISGSDVLTKRTMRFAWHVTTLAWWGIAAVLLVLGAPASDPTGATLAVLAATFAATGIAALIGSRGRHLSWLVFGGIAVLVWLARSST